MGDYKIIDFGYANTTATGTQETRANSGTAITLDVQSIGFNRDSNMSTEPNPGRYEEAETTYASFNNLVLDITCKIKRDDANYSTKLQAVYDLITTKGLKLLYYDDSSASVFMNVIGSRTAVTGQSGLIGADPKALLGRCSGFRLAEGTNDPVRGVQTFSFTFTTSNPST